MNKLLFFEIVVQNSLPKFYTSTHLTGDGFNVSDVTCVYYKNETVSALGLKRRLALLVIFSLFFEEMVFLYVSPSRFMPPVFILNDFKVAHSSFFFALR